MSLYIEMEMEMDSYGGLEDDPVVDLLRFTLYFLHKVLNLLEDAKRDESCEYFPLELHWLPIDTIQILKMTILPILFNFCPSKLRPVLLSCFPGITPSRRGRRFWRS